MPPDLHHGQVNDPPPSHNGDREQRRCQEGGRTVLQAEDGYAKAEDQSRLPKLIVREECYECAIPWAGFGFGFRGSKSGVQAHVMGEV